MREASEAAHFLARTNWPWAKAVLASLTKANPKIELAQFATGLNVWDRVEEWEDEGLRPQGTQLPVEGEPYRPFKILYATAFANVRPTFVVDITKQYDRRHRAILAFASQFRPPKGFKKGKVFLGIETLEDEMNQLARHYGQMIGVRYGEAFVQKEMMKVEDVVEMEVRSV